MIYLHIKGVPSICSQLWFQFMTLLIALSKETQIPKWFNLNGATLIFTKFQKLRIFFICSKISPKPKKNLLRSATPFELYIRIFFSSDSRTPVHGILFFLQIHVPFGEIFSTCKKILNFWNFVNIKVAPFKLNHLGFYCIYSLFW